MSRTKQTTFITNNFRETQKLGAKFTRILLASLVQGVSLSGNIIALYGNLGSGKTSFVQGLVKGLGIKKRIISPTFIIVRTYKIKTQNSKLKPTSQNSKLFYHIDLYRIEGKKDLRGLGIEDIINNPQNIVAIEWAEKIQSLLPKKRIEIYFDYLSENKRRIKVVYLS